MGLYPGNRNMKKYSKSVQRRLAIMQSAQDALNTVYKDIPKHDHWHSVYILCLDCRLWGIDSSKKFLEPSPCGHCNSINTIKYYLSCCILAEWQMSKGQYIVPTPWSISGVIKKE